MDQSNETHSLRGDIKPSTGVKISAVADCGLPPAQVILVYDLSLFPYWISRYMGEAFESTYDQDLLIL